MLFFSLRFVWLAQQFFYMCFFLVLIEIDHCYHHENLIGSHRTFLLKVKPNLQLNENIFSSCLKKKNIQFAMIQSSRIDKIEMDGLNFLLLLFSLQTLYAHKIFQFIGGPRFWSVFKIFVWVKPKWSRKKIARNIYTNPHADFDALALV